MNKPKLARNKTRRNRNKNNRQEKLGNFRLLPCRIRKQRKFVVIHSCGGA